MLLIGEKVRIRPLEEGDLKEFFNWRTSAEAMGAEYNNLNAVDWFAFEKRVKEASTSPSQMTVFMIENLEDKKLVGHIFHTQHGGNTEIGYMIADPANRGKGYATEATRLIVDYLFTTKNLGRIEATSDTRNTASHHVLERCGFRREGTLRNYYFSDGAYRDHFMFSIIRGEWEAKPRTTPT